MVIDRQTFIENYLDELKENIALIDSGILNLKKSPEDKDELAKIMRALHTIKGSSRMLRFSRIESIAHGLESVFRCIKEEKFGITGDMVRLIFITTDYLQVGAKRIKKNQNDDFSIENLLDVFDSVCAEKKYSLDSLKPVDKEVTPDNETIRIKISKTDKISKLLNNVIIKQFQLKKENDVLYNLEMEFRELMSAERGKKEVNPDYAKKENSCLKHIQQLRKDFSLDMALLERDTWELQEEILSLRMLPLDMILGSLNKMVEETAMDIAKEIDFKISGSDVMVDKIILEKLNDPIIHLVRNAVDHGIELPEERKKKGKGSVGQIEIEYYLEDGNIIIRVKDDGQGLDYEKIRERAIELNPMQEEDIRSMDYKALNSILFSSGFSTRKKVQELSGRGVGLDIVRSNISNIKGKTAIDSEKDKGTEFVLTLPLSLATVEGFFILCADEKFLIPSTFVKEVLIINEKQKIDLANRKAIKFRDKIIPIYNLNSIMGKQITLQKANDKIFVMVVDSSDQVMGMVVDSVIQYSSLIYKPLPPNLSRLKLIQGIVFDESYNMINILYIPEIMNRLARMSGIPESHIEKQEAKQILVVDDSYATREIERSILELEDYHVITAGNGVEGLERLQNNHVDLIITDINMPEMDGPEFVKNLRQNTEYMNTPIIVVSSVDDPVVKEEFISEGANAFIIKSHFERGNLIQEVKKLIG